MLRLTAGGVSAVLVVTLAVTANESQAAAAPVAAVPAAAPKAAKVVSRPDLVSARVTALAQGSRVEAESERTGTSSTWVNPDGTSTTDQHAGPIRFRDTDGSWRDVDLTLAEQADGSVAPKGHPGGLRLMGATKTSSLGAPSTTENDVVSTDEGKGGTQGVSLAWGGKLGKPTLAGNRATYAEVQPGVDLVVDALRTGYEQSLVLKTPAALAGLAAGGAEVSWSLPVKTKGLTVRAEADGSVSFVDAKNAVASRLAAPKAWDAGVDPRSGEHTSTALVRLTVAQKGKGRAVLTLTPDQVWLTDPARVFPITIDPTYASATVTTSFDTYVSKQYPTATYSTATELRVGTYNDGVDAVRSFLTFPLASFKGKDIVSASLSLYEFHSWSCTARAFYMYSAYDGTSSATSWSTQKGAPASYGSLTTAKGYSSSCAAGRVSVPATSLVAAYSASASTVGTVRLHASETDNYGWKKFYSLESTQDPYITFTYNRKPNAASAPTLQAPPGVSYVNPGNGVTYLYTSDSTPQLSSTATDPDANTVAMTTEVHTSTTTSASTLKASCVTALVASGATGSCSPTTALADSTLYYTRTAVKDQLGLWNGTWSPWTTFRTAIAAPTAPAITCPAPYSNNSWQDTAPASAVVCTVTAAGTGTTAPAYIWYSLDGAAYTKRAITPSTDPALAKISVTVPNTAGAHSLKAYSQSVTSVNSAAISYGFGYGGANMTAPAATPRVTTTGSVNIAASGPPKGASILPTAKVRWRIASSGANELTGWNDATSTALTLPVDNGPAGVGVTGSWNTAAETADAQLDADANPANGIQPTALNPRVPVLLDVQICLAYSSGTQCTWSQSKPSVMRVPHAFGNGFPTASAGPGQVALFTGEFNASATDASVPGYTGNISLSRSHSTYGNAPTAPTDPITGIFGPGWTASLEGSDAGLGGLQVVDSTRADGTLAFVDQDGTALVYMAPCVTPCTAPRRTTANLTAGTYVPVGEDTELSVTTLAVSGAGATTTLTLTEDDGTKTSFTPGTTAQAPTATTAGVFAPNTVVEPGNLTTTYARDAAGRVTRILAPLPPGTVTATGRVVTCPDGPAIGLDKGCRALRIAYGTGTDGTPAGQVTQVSAELYNPTTFTSKDCADNTLTIAAGMVSIPVACYTYDAVSKRLTAVKDPRTGLGTTYAYGSNNQLTQLASSGQNPVTLAYSTLEQRLKLTAVTRPQPAPLTGIANLSRIVYDAPTSGTGLPALTDTAAWGQAQAPTYAAAVFGPDYTGAVTASGPATAADWSYADLSYTDPEGYTVNTAAYGAGAWQRTSTGYDVNGNVTRQLDAGAIGAITSQGFNPGVADLYATKTVYNNDIKNASGVVITPAGTLVTDTYGPVRNAVLADGSTAAVRPHTETVYDQNAPNTGINPITTGPYRLPTTETTTAADGAGTDVPGQTVTTTTTGYGAVVAGSADGWALGSPTQVTTGGIAHVTGYDTVGRIVDTRQPLSTGTGAGTTKTVYYTAGANTADAGCGNRPEWAGLVCRTYPAGAPSSGPTLPDQRTTGYSMWLQAEQAVETSGTATRTNETRFDPAGRAVASWTTSTIPGSTSRPGTFTHYRDQDGLVDYTGTLNAAKTDADQTARTSSTYDLWGRQLTFTSDLGDTTTTTYDAAGRVGSVVDAKGTTTYGYDGTDAAGKAERRGLATSLTITRGGAAGTLVFSGAYDADGKLVTQKLPGAITATSSYDEAGEPSGLAYSGQVTPVTETIDPDTGEVTYIPGTPLADQPWLAWSQTNDATGRVRRESTGVGAAFDGVPGVSDPADITAPAVGAAISSDREYTYDTAGRLARVGDRTATGYAASGEGAMPCRVRDYAFDNNGNRVGLNTTTHPDGDCASAPGTSTKTLGYDYDDADRPTTAAKIDGAAATGTYTYDEFGRQTTLPADDAPDPAKGNITLAYYDSDLPQAITQNGTTTSYTLSVNDRRQAATTGPTGGPATSTSIRHYTDTSDNPAWIDTTTTTGAGGATSTARYAGSLGGDLGATIAGDGTVALPLANLHGDIVTTITLPATQAATTPCTSIDGWSDYTEYGAPRDTTATTAVAGAAGYGWLGAKERSTTTESAALTLMGDRLYNATTGRFTSLDPEPGGSATAYGYPTDPINTFDLDGHWPGWAKKAWGWAGQHKVDIALTALMFVPGLGAATWAVRAAVWGARALRASRVVQTSRKSLAVVRSIHGFFRSPRVVGGFRYTSQRFGNLRYLKLDRPDHIRPYYHIVRGKITRQGSHKALQHYRWWGRKVD